MARTIKLRFDEHGFAVDGQRASWDAVEVIVTYKVDCIVYDQIVVAIRLEGDHGFILDEEACGPELIGLMEEARKRFATIPEDWYFEVMQPAFATNYKVLWHKPGTPPPPANTHGTGKQSRVARVLFIVLILATSTSVAVAVWRSIQFAWRFL